MKSDSIRHARLAVVAVCVLMVSLGARCEGERGQESITPENLDLGYRSYMANCAACHGDTGGGDGPLADALVLELAVAPLRLDSSGRVSELSRSEIHEVIARGGARTGRSNLMPAWAGELDAGALEATVDYVMAMAASRPTVPEETLREYFSSPAGSASDGRKLYVYYCSACHGPGGAGDGMVSTTLTGGMRPRDLTNTTFMQEKTDQNLYTAIALGGQHAGLSSSMPGWTYELSPEQIRALISYLRAISGTVQAD